MPFVARCPYCRVGVNVPDRAMAASVKCPGCQSWYTATPDGDPTLGRPAAATAPTPAPVPTPPATKPVPEPAGGTAVATAPEPKPRPKPTPAPSSAPEAAPV